MAVSVHGLFVYPIKGCSGIPLQSAPLTSTGLPFDRQWMVVCESNGKFITQRQIPKLCKVSVSMPPEALMGADWGQLHPGAAMVLSAPGMPQLQVPLTTPAAAAPTRVVNVWEWTGVAADEGDEAATWFSKYLDKTVRLVRHIGHTAVAAAASSAGPGVRPVDPEFAPGHEVKFADGFPILVARLENLADLNNRLSAAGEAELPMSRFRPNIVLAGGGAAWTDDGWSAITFGSESSSNNAGGGRAAAGSAALQYVKPCSRCKVTTINQETAEEGGQPLTMLGMFRSGKVLGWSEQRKSWTHSVFFAWNATVLKTGVVHVGAAATPSAKA